MNSCTNNIKINDYDGTFTKWFHLPLVDVDVGHYQISESNRFIITPLIELLFEVDGTAIGKIS